MTNQGTDAGTVTDLADTFTAHRKAVPTTRSSSMLLLNEELARARTRKLQAEAANARLVAQLRAARKVRRRAWDTARRVRLVAEPVDLL